MPNQLRDYQLNDDPNQWPTQGKISKAIFFLKLILFAMVATAIVVLITSFVLGLFSGEPPTPPDKQVNTIFSFEDDIEIYGEKVRVNASIIKGEEGVEVVIHARDSKILSNPEILKLFKYLGHVD